MVRRKKSESIEHTGHSCAYPGCPEEGNFRAPKSRDNSHEFQWFCQTHIAEFNKKWNYFEGMSTEEIYEFQRDATTGHRPTWRMDQHDKLNAAKLEEAFGRMFGDRPTFKATTKPITPKNRDALAQMDLDHPTDEATIKKQYRELVKKYHPDLNHSNKQAEETFKKITLAYNYLLNHYLES